MTWMAWVGTGCLLVALLCFLKGAFALSWDGLPWLFWSALNVVAGGAFIISAAFS